ncbi:hypothetical protein GL50803_0012147 [Giardia duodenalis]|uniref:Uncharacterized protein n=1 Tax=Giardia intestinalis (strain ATCC 50803 / WB clone C6) TaxID=184922 RepID=D3KI61_GIAIC|nr:hypothetical protein GL50803_0012147 [Giardia intestinalis]KAE8302819.1 hypothetical protein GL50803_0012147 [Giardia intestinalis]
MAWQIPGTTMRYNPSWVQKITRELDEVSDGAFSALTSHVKEQLVFERFLLSSTAHSISPDAWQHISKKLGEGGCLQLLGNKSNVVDLLSLEEGCDTIKKTFASVAYTTPIIVEVASCVPYYLLGTTLQTIDDPNIFVYIGGIRTRMLLRLQRAAHNGRFNAAFLAVGAKICVKRYQVNSFQTQSLFCRRPDCSWIDAHLTDCILMGGYDRWKVTSLLKNKDVLSFLVDEHLLQINRLVKRCKRALKKGHAGSIATYQMIKNIAFQDTISFHPVHITLEEFQARLLSNADESPDKGTPTPSTYTDSSTCTVD